MKQSSVNPPDAGYGSGASSDSELAKRSAGTAALGEISSGMTLGLGTGSTVRFFIEALASALDQGKITEIRGVPTSVETQKRCRVLGVPLVELDGTVQLDVAIDGADEIAPSLDLIKGLGGALLREKIVVQAARRFVVIADASKEVGVLGERSPLPVEVVPFGLNGQLPFLRSLGGEPRIRMEPGGSPVLTDNGNHVVDLHFSDGIADPAALEEVLRARAGIVETGLFLGMADIALVADGDAAVRRKHREGVRVGEQGAS